ncbi:cobalt-precorrin-5B (C(1))-methyltransferase CbiD [Oscillospiraceae bacterium LTW-04]|nr:cobalt-precorrin-5B (C(1))-methyltransferase CbiD [Oscillospiraceae bacterium MB24-C1]
MTFEHYVISGAKRLRCGYTTGSCAAMAAGAAAAMLLSGKQHQNAALITPKGIRVEAQLEEIMLLPDEVICAVRKDAGDDCDATDGMLIFASVKKHCGEDVVIDGGVGIGRVTKRGLDQPVGAAAINSIPRQMIAEQVRMACTAAGYAGGMQVTIFAPEGAGIAKKTFNPNLGITGGISILGTSGIVEPQSLSALLDSIEVEIKMLAANGEKRLLLTPGNYAERFAKEHSALKEIPQIKCANFIGDCLDFAAVYDFSEVLLVSHIGKAVKLAGGIMNTHSRVADCRTELFAAHAACRGASREICIALMQAATADACLEILDDAGLKDVVADSLLQAIQTHLSHRAAGAFQVGAAVFYNGYTLLGVTAQGKELLSKWRINA